MVGIVDKPAYKITPSEDVYVVQALSYNFYDNQVIKD